MSMGFLTWAAVIGVILVTIWSLFSHILVPLAIGLGILWLVFNYTAAMFLLLAIALSIFPLYALSANHLEYAKGNERPYNWKYFWPQEKPMDEQGNREYVAKNHARKQKLEARRIKAREDYKKKFSI